MTDLDALDAIPPLASWCRQWQAGFWRFGCEPPETMDGFHAVEDWRIVGTGPDGLAVIRPVCEAAEA